MIESVIHFLSFYMRRAAKQLSSVARFNFNQKIKYDKFDSAIINRIAVCTE